MVKSPVHIFLFCCIALVVALLLLPVAWLAQIAPGVFANVTTVWQDAQPTTIPTPAFLSYQTDPDTGHKVWRLGGNGAEMGGVVNYPDGNEALGILHAQHFYSKVSPVNSAETYVLGAGGQNQPYAALWELATRRLVAWCQRRHRRRMSNSAS